MINKRCVLNNWKKVPLPAARLKSLATDVFGSPEAIPESAKFCYKEKVVAEVEVRLLQKGDLILQSGIRLGGEASGGPPEAPGRPTEASRGPPDLFEPGSKHVKAHTCYGDLLSGPV